LFLVDASFNKDLNGVQVQWGLKQPTWWLVADNRAVYGASQGTWTDYGFPAATNGYVLTNTNKGSAFNTSIKEF
jgi:hypothetical protein